MSHIKYSKANMHWASMETTDRSNQFFGCFTSDKPKTELTIVCDPTVRRFEIIQLLDEENFKITSDLNISDPEL